MNRTTRVLWTAGALILTVVIVMAVVIVRHRRPRGPALQATNAYIQVQPSYAPAGVVVSEFPKDLVIGSSAQVSQSYSVVNGREAESTTTYISPDSSYAIYQKYLSYFSDNRYGIISKAETPAKDSIYAAGKDGDISVMITPGQGQSSIITSFLNKQE